MRLDRIKSEVLLLPPRLVDREGPVSSSIRDALFRSIIGCSTISNRPLRVSVVPTTIPCQFDFDIVLAVLQVHEREIREVQAMTGLQLQRALIEFQRPFEVEYSNHGMNNLRQFRPPAS